MYIAKHFKLYELLPTNIYNQNKFNKSALWSIFDERILITADKIRELLNCQTYINNWYWNGNNQYRGWRPCNCEVGAQFSQHKFGRALDMNFRDYTAEQVREMILNDPWNEAFKFITRIEGGVSWLHIDCANWDKQKHGILVF